MCFFYGCDVQEMEEAIEAEKAAQKKRDDYDLFCLAFGHDISFEDFLSLKEPDTDARYPCDPS